MDSKEKLSGRITDIESTGPFIKIRIAKEPDFSEISEQLEFYNDLFNSDRCKVTTSDLVANKLVVAKLFDGNWYRGRISEVQGNTCKVHAIDLGCNKEVLVDNLCLLQHLKDSRLVKLPTVVIKTVCLSNRVSMEGWKPEVIKAAQEYFFKRQVVYSMVSDMFATLSIKYGTEDKDLASIFQQKNLGNNISPTEEKHMLIRHYEYESLPKSNIAEEPVKQAPVSTSLLIQTKLDVNSCYQVHVSSYDVGPKLFAVKLLESEARLSAIEKSLSSQTIHPLRSILVPNSQCLAVVSSGQSLQRGYVKRCFADSYQVYLVDYGNTITVTPSQIMEMPEQLAKFPPIAIQFTHTGASDLPDIPAVPTIFEVLVKGKTLKLMVTEAEGNLPSCILLDTHNISILESMMKLLGGLGINQISLSKDVSPAHSSMMNEGYLRGNKRAISPTEIHSQKKLRSDILQGPPAYLPTPSCSNLIAPVSSNVHVDKMYTIPVLLDRYDQIFTRRDSTSNRTEEVLTRRDPEATVTSILPRSIENIHTSVIPHDLQGSMQLSESMYLKNQVGLQMKPHVEPAYNNQYRETAFDSSGTTKPMYDQIYIDKRVSRPDSSFSKPPPPIVYSTTSVCPRTFSFEQDHLRYNPTDVPIMSSSHTFGDNTPPKISARDVHGDLAKPRGNFDDMISPRSSMSNSFDHTSQQHLESGRSPVKRSWDTPMHEYVKSEKRAKYEESIHGSTNNRWSNNKFSQDDEAEFNKGRSSGSKGFCREDTNDRYNKPWGNNSKFDARGNHMNDVKSPPFGSATTTYGGGFKSNVDRNSGSTYGSGFKSGGSTFGGGFKSNVDKDSGSTYGSGFKSGGSTFGGGFKSNVDKDSGSTYGSGFKSGGSTFGGGFKSNVDKDSGSTYGSGFKSGGSTFGGGFKSNVDKDSGSTYGSGFKSGGSTFGGGFKSNVDKDSGSTYGSGFKSGGSTFGGGFKSNVDKDSGSTYGSGFKSGGSTFGGGFKSNVDKESGSTYGSGFKSGGSTFGGGFKSNVDKESGSTYGSGFKSGGGFSSSKTGGFGSELKNSGFEGGFNSGRGSKSRGGFSGSPGFGNRFNRPPALPKLRFTPQELTPSKTKIDVISIFMISPGDFCVQTESTSEELTMLMDRIREECEDSQGDTQIEFSQLAPFDACLAKFKEDGLWYRSQVISVNGDKVKVKFVDYGNVVDVEVSDLKLMTSELLTLPMQAINCSLRGVKPAGLEWSEEQLNKFTELIDSFTLQAEVVGLEGLCLRQYSVVLHNKGTCLNTEMGASPESLLPCTSLPVSDLAQDCTHDVVISWFLTPDNFHVFLSTNKQERDYMYTEFSDMECPSLQSVEAGQLVLAHKNKDYFRGKILATRDTKARVMNLDIGNIQICEVKELRVMPESLKSKPAFAVPCEMFGITPKPGPEWPRNSAAINTIFQSSPNFTLSVQGKHESGKLLVSLQAAGKDVAKTLVEQGLASEIVIQEEKLSPGHTCKVFVCYSEGPRKFFLHEVAKQEELKNLQKHLDVLNPQTPAIMPASLIAAKNPDDDMWYRAKPLRSTEKEFTILFVDYGNINTVSAVMQLPADVCVIPYFATECRLAIQPLAGHTWPQQAIEKFESLVFEDNVSARVLAKYQGCLLVDLIVNGDKSVIESMVQEKLAQPMMCDVYFSNVESPSQFYVQQVKDEATLDEIQNRLGTEEFEDADTLEVGMKCIAKFSADDAWYRAQVLSINDGVTNVQFMDYGNCAEASEFKKLPSDMLNIDALAKLCSLAAKPVSEEEKQKFLDTVIDGTIKFQVLYVDSQQTPAQVIVLRDGKEIVELTTEQEEAVNVHTETTEESMKLNPTINLLEHQDDAESSHTEQQDMNMDPTINLLGHGDNTESSHTEQQDMNMDPTINLLEHGDNTESSHTEQQDMNMDPTINLLEHRDNTESSHTEQQDMNMDPTINLLEDHDTESSHMKSQDMQVDGSNLTEDNSSFNSHNTETIEVPMLIDGCELDQDTTKTTFNIVMESQLLQEDEIIAKQNFPAPNTEVSMLNTKVQKQAKEEGKEKDVSVPIKVKVDLIEKGIDISKAVTKKCMPVSGTMASHLTVSSRPVPPVTVDNVEAVMQSLFAEDVPCVTAQPEPSCDANIGEKTQFVAESNTQTLEMIDKSEKMVHVSLTEETDKSIKSSYGPAPESSCKIQNVEFKEESEPHKETINEESQDIEFSTHIDKIFASKETSCDSNASQSSEPQNLNVEFKADVPSKALILKKVLTQVLRPNKEAETIVPGLWLKEMDTTWEPSTSEPSFATEELNEDSDVPDPLVKEMDTTQEPCTNEPSFATEPLDKEIDHDEFIQIYASSSSDSSTDHFNIEVDSDYEEAVEERHQIVNVIPPVTKDDANED